MTVVDGMSTLRFSLMIKTGFLGALSARTRYGSMGSSSNNSPVSSFATIGKTSSFGHLDLSIGDISIFEIYASTIDSSLTRNGFNFNIAMYCCNCKSKGINYIILLRRRFYRIIYSILYIVYIYNLADFSYNMRYNVLNKNGTHRYVPYHRTFRDCVLDLRFHLAKRNTSRDIHDCI